MNNFIYDLFSLSSKDINEWSKKFFWPISLSETQKILNDLLKIHATTVDDEKDIFIKLNLFELFKPCMRYRLTSSKHCMGPTRG